MELFDWTGLRWQFDVNVLDRNNAYTLRRLASEGWIVLESCDTTRVEIAEATDEKKRARLEDLAWQFPMPMGPFMFGHSQLDFSVSGSDEDAERIRVAYGVLWPGNVMADDARPTSNIGRRRFRDALHVATAIRYAFSAFITCDRGILAKRGLLAEEFSGFSVLCVHEATRLALQAIQSVHELRAFGTDYYDDRTPPPWPTAQDCAEGLRGIGGTFACDSCPRPRATEGDAEGPAPCDQETHT